METLDDIFLDAEGAMASWSESDVNSVLKKLCSAVRGSRIGWEEGDENWASIFGGGEVIFLVCTVVPVVMCSDKYFDVVESIFKSAGLRPIIFERYNEAAFSVSLDILTRIFGPLAHIEDNEALSAGNLWYATI